MSGPDSTDMWRPIRGFTGIYEVSRDGRVRRVAGGQGARAGEIAVHPHSRGYRTCRLWLLGVAKTFLVHRLVADAFVDNPSSLPAVNHIDGVRHNNCADNLEWVSSAQNSEHAQYALRRVGRLSPEAADQIRAAYREGALQKDLARRFGVSQNQISMIVMGRSWKRGAVPLRPATTTEVRPPSPEVWGSPAGMPGLLVSSRGRLRLSDGTDLAATPSRGYLIRTLPLRAGARKTVKVHRLVAEVHLGPAPHSRAMVNHKNGDRADNRVENLEWVDAAGNMRHRFGHEYQPLRSSAGAE